MKHVLKIALIVLVSSSAISAPLIIGGVVDTLKTNNGVFQLAIQDSKETGACTATKISKNFIITAAHCLHGLEIRGLGFSSEVTNNKMEYAPLEFERIFIHPDYEKLSVLEAEEMHSSFSSPDIAIIKIKPDSEFDKIKAIEVNYDLVSDDKGVEIWGYGCQKTINKTDDYSPVRKVGSSYTISKARLNEGHELMGEYYGHFADPIYTTNILTAGNKMDASVSSLCFGDSGGPLVLDGKLVGINSNYTFNDLDPNDENSQGEGVSYINLHARISNVAKWIQVTLGL